MAGGPGNPATRLARYEGDRAGAWASLGHPSQRRLPARRIAPVNAPGSTVWLGMKARPLAGAVLHGVIWLALPFASLLSHPTFPA
jgi:hypothetical protein